jgi:hypothetical protein
LPGQREVDGQAVGDLGGGADADHEHQQPEHHHQASVVQDELGKTDHQ